MAEYSGLIDRQISEILGFKGRVTTEQLPGLSAEDAAVCLRQYALIHAHERALVFDGEALQWAPEGTPDGATAGGSASVTVSAPERSTLSPVDQVLAASGGPSLLDTARSEGPVNKGMWTLPVALGLPGGILAWFIVRGERPRTARNMLITGAVVQVISIALGFLIAPMLGGAGGDASSSATRWQPSASGLPTVYYFNRATSAEGQEMTPVIDDLAREYAGRVEFVLYSDLAIDPTAAAFAKRQGIQSEPAIVLVKSTGEELQRWMGVRPRDEIDIAIGNAAAR